MPRSPGECSRDSRRFRFRVRVRVGVRVRVRDHRENVLEIVVGKAIVIIRRRSAVGRDHSRQEAPHGWSHDRGLRYQCEDQVEDLVEELDSIRGEHTEEKWYQRSLEGGP